MTATVSLNQQLDKPLAGLRVLVTRPVNQADGLIKQLNELGAIVLHQPAIEIKAADIDNSQQSSIAPISQFNWLVFISKNAVHYGLDLLTKEQPFSPSQQLAVIGKATKAELLDLGYGNIFCPDNGFDSEALLETAAFSAENISKKQILIVRGGQGREHLKETLEERGATVSYLDVYQRKQATRVLIDTDFNTLDIITFSSQQGLDNIMAMLSPATQQSLLTKLVITPSLRCSEKAVSLGFKTVETAANATDNAMLNCIINKVTNSTETGCNDSNPNN